MTSLLSFSRALFVGLCEDAYNTIRKMSSKPIGPIQQAWYRWKALKLPWRKRFLIGLDLQGNTFWEFRDSITAGRMRRIAQYPASTHYSEIKISPQWHQWLRHTRVDPPSLTEQSQDIVRQSNLKVLAAEADARWAAKGSFLDAPKRPELSPAEIPEGVIPEADASTKTAESEGHSEIESEMTVPDSEGQSKPKMQTPDGIRHHFVPAAKSTKKEDSWKQQRGGPSEGWQPQAWDGSFTSPPKRK